jgi:hypothetical protein
VNQLQVNAYPSKVGLIYSGAFVEFKFSSLNGFKAGSFARLIFWPGDSKNVSQGPFLLGMDYNLNENLIPISYSYQSVGIYNAILFVQNKISSMYMSCQVTVYSGLIDQFYIDVQPAAVLPMQTFKVFAYLVYGWNVTFTWNFNATTIVTQRICMIY